MTAILGKNIMPTNFESTAIALKQQAALLKASADEATFSQPHTANFQQILQGQCDAQARRSAQALTETAAGIR